MAINYAAGIPVDERGNVLQGYPAPFKANARYSTNNATVSSVITLNDNTTVVEVAAVGAAVAVRWVPASESAAVSPFASVITTSGATANFDYIVPKDGMRRFVAPVETQGVNSIVGIGVQAGTYRRIAVMSNVAVSSILVGEF